MLDTMVLRNFTVVKYRANMAPTSELNPHLIRFAHPTGIVSMIYAVLSILLPPPPPPVEGVLVSLSRLVVGSLMSILIFACRKIETPICWPCFLA
jgi:hypothetical protein